jgi:hypothetical protein
MRHRLTVALTTLALAACGRGEEEPAAQMDAAAPATAAATAPVDVSQPCALLTQAELGKVLGTPVTRQEEPSGTRCIYYTDDPVVFLDLEIDRQNAAAPWEGINQGNSMIDAPQDSLAGIGDQAFFGPRNRLYVLRGNTFMAIEAGFDDKVRGRAKRVAGLALRKLQ